MAYSLGAMVRRIEGMTHMADETNTQTAAPTSEAKPKTVAEDMPARSMFATPADAAAALNRYSQELSDFGNGHAIIARGITTGENDELNFDPAVYTPDMRVMLATLTQRQEKGPSKVTAIVITPAPTLDAILAADGGRDWLQKIADKELNHVAVRPLRNPKEGESLDELSEKMPLTVAEYITSSRESSGGALETFNELARGVIDAIAKKSKPWAKARLTKPELKAAMASRAYASEYYPVLEDRGEGKESLFVMAMNFGKTVAAAKGLDPAIFDRWLSSRDQATLATKADEDENGDDFDLEALTFDDSKTEKAAAPAPAAEGQTVEQPAPAQGGGESAEQQPTA